MDIILALVDFIESKTIAIFLLLVIGLTILFFNPTKIKEALAKLSIFHRIAIYIILLSVLLIIFSRIFDPNVKYYQIFFNKNLLKTYFFAICFCCIFLLLLYLVSKFYLKISTHLSPIKRWKMLCNFPLFILTEKKHDDFLMHIIYVLTILGANKKAIFYEKQITNLKKSEFYHLLKIERAYLKGNITEQIQFSDAAVISINKHTKTLYQHQFYMNKAIGYYLRHDYRNADINYKEAFKFIQSKKIKNIHLIFDFYKDFLINKVCLRTDNSEIQNCFEEFKSKINKKNPEHWMLYFDLKLSVLQQSKAANKEFDINIEDSLKKLEELNIKEKTRTLYAIKIARIITSCYLNPEHCIRMLTYKTKYLSKLSFLEKYPVYKDLAYLFSNLRGPILICVSDLIEETKRYFKNDAEKEINAYLETLPPEAIFERINFIKELACLRKNTDKQYEFADIKNNLLSAINLCEENELTEDAMLMRLNIADEAFSPINLNDDGTSKYSSEIENICKEVSKFALKLQKSPFEAQLDFRLSYYYLRIHDYKNHIKFYDRFVATNHPKDFFAAWCRIYIDICNYTATILKSLEALEKIANSKQTNVFSVETKQFLSTYKTSNGKELSVIFGFLFAQDFAIKRCTLDFGNSKTEHFWLCGLFGLEIDPLYKNFKTESNNEQIFFVADKHPMQTKKSETAKKTISCSTELIPKGTIVFDEEFLLIFTEIKDAIIKELGEKH